MTYIFLSLIVGIYLLYISLEREREGRGKERDFKSMSNDLIALQYKLALNV
jgi:hypothetical protein